MPSLSSFCATEKPGHRLLDDEGGDAARARVRIGLGVDHQRVGVRPVGDPHLGAVEHVAVVVLFGAQPAARRRRSRRRIPTWRARRPVRPSTEPGRYFCLLLRRAPAVDLVDAEIGMRAVGQADRGRGARNLLHRDDMGEIAHAGAAVIRIGGDAEQAERAEFLPQMRGEFVASGRSRRRAARSAPARSGAPCRAARRCPRRARSSACSSYMPFSLAAGADEAHRHCKIGLRSLPRPTAARRAGTRRSRR